MKRPEQTLQTAIVVALRRRFDCFVTHVPNGGARTRLEAMAFRDAGLTAGTPDLLVLGPGARVALIEVKAKVQVRDEIVLPLARRHSLSDAQKAVADLARGYGHHLAVVRSVEEAVDVLGDLEFPLRGTHVARPRQPATGF